MAESMQSKLQKKESFWRNIITWGGLAAAAGTALYFWSLIVPFLIDVAANTVELVGLLALLGGLAYVALDKRMRSFIAYLYNSGTRWLISQFINIDPIGVLRNFVNTLKEKISELDKAIASLRGQRDDLKKTIDSQEEEANRAIQQAAAARKDARFKTQVALKGRQAGRLQQSNMTLQKLYIKISAMHDAMVKRREAADVTLQDIQAEVDVRTRERKALMAGYRAFRAAQGVLDVNNPEHEMYDMALENLANDYAEKMGEIDTFLDLSKGITDGVDLDNMVFEEDAIAKIDAWEKSKGNVRVADPAVNYGPRVDAEAEEASPNSFSSLFDSESKKQNQVK
jgi:hypothetical protein